MPRGMGYAGMQAYTPLSSQFGTAQQSIMQAAQFYDQLQQRRRMETALRGPLAQQMISGITGVSPVTALGPDGLPQQINGATGAAGIMAPYTGQAPLPRSMPPVGVPVNGTPNTGRVIEYIPGGEMETVTPLLPSEQAPGTTVSAPTGDAQSGYGEQVDIMAPRTGMMGPRGPFTAGPSVSRAPMSLEEYEIFQRLAPQYTQMQVVREAASGSMNRQRERLDNTTKNAEVRNGLRLLELDLKHRKLIQDGQIAMRRLSQKKGGTGNKDLEMLRKVTKDAQDSMDEVQGIIASLDAQGASAAEPGSPLRINYDRAVSQLAEATRLYRSYQGALDTAMRPIVQRQGGGNAAPPKAPKWQDLSSLSDTDLDAKLNSMSPAELEALANQ